jgi:hypothetical protein
MAGIMGFFMTVANLEAANWAVGTKDAACVHVNDIALKAIHCMHL